ncbi:DUF6468 domain-containing protein [Pelagibacterium montanilacus]|uniref:DUF6468 domain-containing protein n=1 Tax=Pelagibacterium montanilacus TaxID=2185280 RepID=UPI000F8F6F32|nr:DUF6468 domain-containing protein [Pelagibacterium montanilacus]
MSGLPLGLVIEAAVALLLATTIGYCIVLNRKLNALHSDRAALEKMIGDLVSATDLANKAIRGMRETAVESDQIMTARLAEAERFGVELANHVNAGQAVMDRIARITQAVRRDDEPAANRARSALQALNQHEQRRRETAA